MKKEFRSQAVGAKPADLVLKHCSLVNVLSGEIENDATIAICGSQIVGIGADYAGLREIDLAGKYVYPAFIDAHIHLESTKLTVTQAARIMAKFGTGTVVTDPHEIANVSGLEGIAYQMDCASDNDFINVFFTAPSCVPALQDPDVETFGNVLGPSKLRMIRDNPWVVALGEMMNVPGLLMQNEKVLQKIADYREAGRTIDGHAPMVTGAPLNACVYEGVDSDHESTNLVEALEKVRRGMSVMIREGSSERNLDALLPAVNAFNAMQFMFASDDLDPTDLMRRGHINHLVARAVKAGIPAIRAIQMATVFPARHFKIDERVGAIKAGNQADLVIANNLVDFIPESVMHNGHFVYQDGREIDTGRQVARYLKPAMNVKLPSLDALAVVCEAEKKLRVIDLVPGQILTNEAFVEPSVEDGLVVADASRGIAKVCVFERHRGSGAFGKAFVRGFNMKCGAIGSSVGHDSHNIIVVGMNDEDMLNCLKRIQSMNGGQAAVLGDQSASLPLPVAGLMSADTAENVVSAEGRLDEFCENVLGVTLCRPMAALSFMSLPVIPNLRITDQGLFYVAPGAYPIKVGLFE